MNLDRSGSPEVRKSVSPPDPRDYRTSGLPDLRTVFTELLPSPGSILVVAVSGGADSMALWDLLVRDGRWRLVIWHLNHGLRPAASEDAALIHAQAARYQQHGLAAGDLIIEQAAIAELARKWKLSLESAGRRWRYERLAAVAQERGASAVVTAHHRDDQSETVLANLLRGAGPIGRAGIAAQRRLANGVLLVRPLLRFARNELRAHAFVAGVPWLDDATNQDQRYRRNFLRHAVLPTLEAGVPGIGAALAELGERSRQRLLVSEATVDTAWQQALGVHEVQLAALNGLPAEQRTQAWRRLAQHLGVPIERATLRRIEELAGGGLGRRLHLGSWLLLRRARTVAWEPADPSMSLETVVITGPGTVVRGDHQLEVVVLARPTELEFSPTDAWLDATQCRWPLTWRPALAEERFTPLGAPGQQTVVKFLAGRGVPSRQRQSAAVVADTNGVVWVPGFSIAERAKVMPGTCEIVHLRWCTTCRGDAPPTVPPLQDPAHARHQS